MLRIFDLDENGSEEMLRNFRKENHLHYETVLKKVLRQISDMSDKKEKIPTSKSQKEFRINYQRFTGVTQYQKILGELIVEKNDVYDVVLTKVSEEYSERISEMSEEEQCSFFEGVQVFSESIREMVRNEFPQIWSQNQETK